MITKEIPMVHRLIHFEGTINFMALALAEVQIILYNPLQTIQKMDLKFYYGCEWITEPNSSKMNRSFD